MTEVLMLPTPAETESVKPFGGTVFISNTPDGTHQIDRLELEPPQVVTSEMQSLAGDAALAGIASSGEGVRSRRTLREYVATSWVGRIAATATAALAFYGANSAFESTPASAATTLSAEIIDTGGTGLWLHAGSPTGPLDRTMPDGDHLEAQCFEQGPSVDGYIDWLKGTDEASGDIGFASDAFLYTNTDTANETAELESQGLPQCDTTSPVDDNSGSDQFLGVSNVPNGDNISVPSNLAGAPWNFQTTTIHDEIDHVAWVVNPAGYGMTLEVFPTNTGMNLARLNPNYAFAEAAADGNLNPNSPYWNTMESQFACHALVVAVVAPGKASWNLDTGRPDLGVEGDIAKQCNPQ